MDTAVIRYGFDRLELTKSPSLLALRPSVAAFDRNRGASSRIAAGYGLSEAGHVGEFALFRLNHPDDAAAKPSAMAGLRAAAISVSEVYYTSDDQVPFVPTGEIHICFRGNEPIEDQSDLMIDLGLQHVETLDDGSLVVCTTEASPDPITTVTTLQASDCVAFAEPDLVTPLTPRQILAIDGDSRASLLREQWHLRNTGYHSGTSVFFKKGADARVVEAWRAAGSYGTAEATVAVLDFGFDLSHPGLAEKGIVPWDLANGSQGPGKDPVETCGGLESWHGTACASVAVGLPAPGVLVGAAPGASLMPAHIPLHVSDRLFEAWLDHVARQGAWIVACGWGPAAKHFPLSHRKFKAIRRCATEGRGGKGCIVVVAAGNENRPIVAPGRSIYDGIASHPDVIAVGASNSRDFRANYSNFGKELWICAPSTGAGGAGIPGGGGEAGPIQQAVGGTSFACAQLAGICALILSANPELSAGDVKTILRHTARKIGKGYDASGHSRSFGFGCVHAEAAVNTARGFNVITIWPGARRR